MWKTWNEQNRTITGVFSPTSNSPSYEQKTKDASAGFSHSYGHPYNREKGCYDSGSDWLMCKTEWNLWGNEVVAYNPSPFTEGHPIFIGQFMPDNAYWAPGAEYGVYNYSQYSSNPAETWGADAWAHARARLTAPDFSALVPIYELREIPEMLKGNLEEIINHIKHPSNAKKLKAIGEFNLAVLFGWVPLLKDIKNFVDAHKNAQQHADQLIRDNGKIVRRRGWLHKEDHDGPVDSWYGYGGMTGFDGPSTPIPHHKTWSNTKIRVWYSGAFQYWLPPFPDPVQYRKSLIRQLQFNTRITPSAVWQAMPWSWLADWFVGVGDFLKAVSPGVEDRLAARYFYVMYEKIDTGYKEVSAPYWYAPKHDSTAMVNAGAVSKNVVKARFPASPFGFGVSQDSLSSMQLAILGSLGLSRL